MSEIALILIALIEGIVVGLISYDMKRRKDLEETLKVQEESHRNAAETLSKAHNSTVQKYEEVNSRLSALEMKSVQKDATVGIKRF